MRVILFMLLFSVAGCVTENINTVLSTHELHEIRLGQLHDFCAKVNEEITAIQVIVNAGWKEADYITGVEETTEGYSITFAKGGTVKITNGKKGENGPDGEDGENGENGEDGSEGEDGLNGLNAPRIGVKKHTDGIYYWTTTLNDATDWLHGEGGEMLRVTGEDGDPGEDGTDGRPGADGVMPVLSVDADGYWLINGKPVVHNGQPVRATGMPGAQGDAGKDGEIIGSSTGLLIKEVEDHPGYTVFTLALTNEKFTVAKMLLPMFRFDDPTPALFYPGQTLYFSYTSSNIAGITVIVPTGWEAENEATDHRLKISALSEEDSYGDRTGEITVVATNPTGQSLTQSLSVSAKMAYEVRQADFKASGVYHLLSPEGTKVGELCTEYIPGFSEDIRAEVVYPYNAREKSYGRGFVLNGGGYVNHDGLGYTGKEGTHYTTVYITGSGIITDVPSESTPTTQQADLLTDIDNNSYPITKIGRQYWITRNWSCTRYTDGSPISRENDRNLFKIRGGKGEALYCYPNNKPDLQSVYGLIYNWFVIHTGKLCPEGWHVPSCDPISGDSDYHELTDFLGKNDAIKLRSTGLGQNTDQGEWLPENSDAGNNISGFNALPAGCAISDEYRYYGKYGIFRTTSHSWYNNAYGSDFNTIDIRNYMGQSLFNALNLSDFYGGSIRLLRNN